MMYKVTIENHQTFEVSLESNHITLNNKKFEMDMVEERENYFHVIRNNKSSVVEIVSADFKEKTFGIKINGKVMNVAVKDKFDLLLEELGMADLAQSTINNIKAPMPGLILEISVKENQEVVKGDQLLILEAMKMENVIKSPGEGIIKSIKVSNGQSVEKGEVLIEF